MGAQYKLVTLDAERNFEEQTKYWRDHKNYFKIFPVVRICNFTNTDSLICKISVIRCTFLNVLTVKFIQFQMKRHCTQHTDRKLTVAAFS